MKVLFPIVVGGLICVLLVYSEILKHKGPDKAG
jgi:hypothetical protein